MYEVILPVLNEAGAIPWVLDRMPADYLPIVVDNGSSDGSAALARKLGARVVEEPRRGFGAACHAGLGAAVAEIVCFMDCDGSLDPRELPKVVAPVASSSADLVIGRRVPEKHAWELHARLANRALVAWIRRRHSLSIADLGPMRAARRVPLLQLGLRDRRFGWPLEMVLRAADAGWRIEQVPVGYRARTGRSKVTGTALGTLRTVLDMSKAMTERVGEEP